MSLLAVVTIASTAGAATLTWTGASSKFWSDAGNWGGVVPAEGDDLVFPAGAANQTNTNDLGGGFSSVRYEGGAYYADGNPIVLGAGGLNVSGGSALFAIHTTLGTAQTWSFSGSGQIDIHGDIALNGHTLTVANSASGVPPTLFSDISGSASPDSIVVQGPGNLRLAGNNSFSGEVWVQSGRLTVAGPSAIPAAMMLRNDGYYDQAGYGGAINGVRGTGTFDLNGADITINGSGAVNTFVGSGKFFVFSGVFGGNSPAPAGTAELGSVEMAGGLYAGNVTARGIVWLSEDATVGPLNVTGFLRPKPYPSGTQSYSGDLSFSNGAYYGFITNGFNRADGGRLNVRGSVTLTGGNLTWAFFNFGGPTGVSSEFADTYTLISNDGSDPVIGTFNGLPEGALVTPFQLSAPRYHISYVGGDGNDVTLTREPYATMTVTSSSNPSVYGHPVTFTFTVAAHPAGSTTPTGTVTVWVRGTNTAVVPLDAGGVATYTTSSLSLGGGGVSGDYSGDGNYQAASVSMFQQVIADGPPTTTTLTSSQNPSLVGQAIVLTAHVTSPDGTIPTGTVTFLEGCCSAYKDATLDATGTATFSITPTAGTHSYFASYLGDSTHPPSKSTALVQTVSAESLPTTTTLTSSQNPSASGQSVTLTARVTSASGIPTGTVSFLEGVRGARDVALDANGEATLTISDLIVGAHSIVARYNGDATHATSSSAPLTQTVSSTLMASSLTLATSKNPSLAGEAVTLVIAVEGLIGLPAPAGNVVLTENGVPFATVPLDANGHATLTRTFPYGMHLILGIYGGDGSYAGSSDAMTQMVDPLARRRAAGRR